MKSWEQKVPKAAAGVLVAAGACGYRGWRSEVEAVSPQGRARGRGLDGEVVGSGALWVGKAAQPIAAASAVAFVAGGGCGSRGDSAARRRRWAQG